MKLHHSDFVDLCGMLEFLYKFILQNQHLLGITVFEHLGFQETTDFNFNISSSDCFLGAGVTLY